MKFKTEPLYLLKVVIHKEDLGEDWTATAADHLCTVHLRTHMHTHTAAGVDEFKHTL